MFLGPFLHMYKLRRPHGGINGFSPVCKLVKNSNNLSSTHICETAKGWNWPQLFSLDRLDVYGSISSLAPVCGTVQKLSPVIW